MNDADRRLMESLFGAEVDYAAAYAEHLSIGEPEPARPPGVDPTVCADIRAVLHREWNGRLFTSPALSGRLRIERGRRSG